jgi:hypothetical protein
MRFLKYLNRMRKGQQAVFLEYEIDFRQRWVDDHGNPHLAPIVAGGLPRFETNLQELTAFEPLVRNLIGPDAKPPVNWRNGYIPALDGLTIMWAAARASGTFMEVGSGNSTIFARHAINHAKSSARIVSIDPQPRVEINALCDEVIRQRVEDVDLSLFDRLSAGDVLFVDNSHRSFMNSDVTTIMLDVIPRLKPGVLVGIHDIFLPFDYLARWKERGFNEQYLLGSYLIANPAYFDLQFCNYWISHNNLHVEPLAAIWSLLGPEIRDRKSSAFWAFKAH